MRPGNLSDNSLPRQISPADSSDCSETRWHDGTWKVQAHDEDHILSLLEGAEPARAFLNFAEELLVASTLNPQHLRPRAAAVLLQKLWEAVGLQETEAAALSAQLCDWLFRGEERTVGLGSLMAALC